ncbi:hypothetical protein Acr_23g0000820 [Actinidia rufa]|uniref:Uncharacterized protein n=1 Tax=Actinidia rufa TaxID=165716 RepID=A0A7J0GLJ4_9ERIC|nr:hypothetical protein Acr_23g0000820 [Actinidia rufa]
MAEDPLENIEAPTQNSEDMGDEYIDVVETSNQWTEWRDVLAMQIGNTELKNLRNKQLPFYDDWCIIFGKDRATGEFAEGPTDAVENLEKEAANNNGMPQQSEGGVGVEMDFSMLGTYLERSSGQLEFIGHRMGYHHDLSNARRSINAELLKLPIGPDDRLAALDIIAASAQRVDVFSSLFEEDKLRYIIKLLA